MLHGEEGEGVISLSVERSGEKCGVIILQDVMSGAGEEARGSVLWSSCEPGGQQTTSVPAGCCAVLWCHSSIHSTELAESYITFYCENQQLKLQ